MSVEPTQKKLCFGNSSNSIQPHPIFPLEIWQIIFAFCSVPQIVLSKRVCKQLYSMVNEDAFLKLFASVHHFSLDERIEKAKFTSAVRKEKLVCHETLCSEGASLIYGKGFLFYGSGLAIIEHQQSNGLLGDHKKPVVGFVYEKDSLCTYDHSNLVKFWERKESEWVCLEAVEKTAYVLGDSCYREIKSSFFFDCSCEISVCKKQNSKWIFLPSFTQTLSKSPYMEEPDPSEHPTSLFFKEDYLFIGYLDGSVKIWLLQKEEWKLEATFEITNECPVSYLHYNQKWLCMGFDNGKVQMSKKEEISWASTSLFDVSSESISCLFYKNEILFTGSSNKIGIWNFQNRKLTPVQVLHHCEFETVRSLNYENGTLVSGSSSAIKMWQTPL